MSPEAQRIAIAEAYGWTKCHPYEKIQDMTPRWFWHGGYYYAKELPDYLNDLNAMHEAEKVLTAEQQSIFVTKLCDIAPNRIGEDWRWLIVHATAAQRAEALLKTLGKWDDSK